MSGLLHRVLRDFQSTAQPSPDVIQLYNCLIGVTKKTVRYLCFILSMSPRECPLKESSRLNVAEDVIFRFSGMMLLSASKGNVKRVSSRPPPSEQGLLKDASRL